MAVAMARPAPVCSFWLEGRCKRNPCRFFHPPAAAVEHDHVPSSSLKPPVRVTLIAHLAAHHPGSSIRGIALPRSSSTLFTAGQDGFLRAWDCSTGLCNHSLSLGQPASCLFKSFDNPNWLFVGLATEVRVFNLANNTQQSLPVGSPVLSLTSLGDHFLLAGLEQGSILVWRFDAASTAFTAAASLLPAEEHCLSAVRTLELVSSAPATATKMLVSGHVDGTLRVWDMVTGKCMDTLQAHHGAVTQILSCGPEWMLSSSYADSKIALWKIYDGMQTSSATTTGNHLLELFSTHVVRDAEQCLRPLAMRGCFDEDNTAMLFASYSNNAVQVLELPSFTERAIILTEKPIPSMETGAQNLLFLGSSDGCLTVWSWSKQA